jgi:hypothetical protein
LPQMLPRAVEGIRGSDHLGEVPPGWAIGEARRLGELFGLAGARSRILRRPGEAGAPDPSNPFLNRSRPPGPESDRR